MKKRADARLVLEDGTVLLGRSAGAEGEATGELVFNTALSGYQEILTDPSYHGQVILMTYPLIGNYGIAPGDDESGRPGAAGLVVREMSRIASNYRAGTSLPAYLRDQGVVAIDQVDTRFLTRKVRTGGAMRVLLSTDTEASDEELVARCKKSPSLEGRDLVQEVTRKEEQNWDQGFLTDLDPREEFSHSPRPRIPIVAVDCGIKRNILRCLVETGFDIRVVPAHTKAEDILSTGPKGIFLSNGPGDPSAVPYLVETVRKLIFDHSMTTFGICLGHQILAQVLGAKTFKMKFGHHGGNHPVRDLRSGRIHITSQNHSFAVDPDTLPDSVEITHLNLNDQSIEGIAHRELPVWSVQHHPEASPGPHDAMGLFQAFYERLSQ
ncbi:MAG TPA: carbamoyl-phosphate synthase small subunit [Planctomycetes bacterium]|nr:carbamoyl-phosphate synthase small subunit [Planctomycetota bacterium]